MSNSALLGSSETPQPPSPPGRGDASSYSSGARGSAGSTSLWCWPPHRGSSSPVPRWAGSWSCCASPAWPAWPWRAGPLAGWSNGWARSGSRDEHPPGPLRAEFVDLIVHISGGLSGLDEEPVRVGHEWTFLIYAFVESQQAGAVFLYGEVRDRPDDLAQKVDDRPHVVEHDAWLVVAQILRRRGRPLLPTSPPVGGYGPRRQPEAPL